MSTSDDNANTEVFVTYFLDNGSGLYDKTGLIIKETDTLIKFKTQSETYRIIEEEYIERKQRCGWYKLGTVEHLATREASKKYLYD